MNIRDRRVLSAGILAACLAAEILFTQILKINIVYTHVFYIPVFLAALWWGFSWGVALSFGFAALHYLFGFRSAPLEEAVRSAVFFGVGTSISLLSSVFRINREQMITITRENEKQAELFRNLFENNPDGIVLCDKQENVIDANAAFLEMFGWNIREAQGLPLADVVLGEAEEYQNGVALGRRIIEGELIDQKVTRYRRDGAAFPVSIVGVPVHTDTEEPISCCVYRDLTDLQRSYEKLRSMVHSGIETFGQIIEQRDPYTAGHQKRVAELALAIARETGMRDDEAEGVYYASLVHDIGKISIPAEILSKPAKLNEMEFALLKGHPEAGADILASIDFPWPVSSLVRQHHERMDGSGYPLGLRGDAILPGARVIAVADVVEAMASDRPYRPSLGLDAALDEIASGKGRLFDARAVDACLALFRENRFSWSAAAVEGVSGKY